MDRRVFLRSITGPLLASAARPAAGWTAGSLVAASPALLIDRRARLGRHDPVIRAFDPLAPLSVGNGGFAFTADATGLQTFPENYREIPLAIEAEWGWHSFANPAGYTLGDATVAYDAHGRRVPYASGQNTPAGEWLRQNPHRLSLAQLGFLLRRRDGAQATAADLRDVEQRLDLWTGTLESRFRLEAVPVGVWTRVDPARDLVAIRVVAELPPGALAFRLAFPYSAGSHTGDPADWHQAERHRTELLPGGGAGARWRRTLDATVYHVDAAWSPGARLVQESVHEFRLTPPAGSASFDLVLSFSPTEQPEALPTVDRVGQDCAAHWERFWSVGGCVDLAGSADPRATELERRIVLSEYLTAIQCAGQLPPQETGETFNSWFGKFHLEMHWWHAAHFALWSRVGLLERSLPWYGRILPAARETAREQGYAGARWPKMVGPDGRESPSTVGVFLIWQQPHPIYLAELVFRARRERSVLEAYREIVFETATFMASYPFLDPATGRFTLGPPLIPAQEIHPAVRTFNPTFELAYWRFALQVAQRWRERLGLAREPAWDRVARLLAPLLDAEYGSASFVPVTRSIDLELRISTTGLLIREMGKGSA